VTAGSGQAPGGGLIPYDLTLPARWLFPRFHCIGQPHDMRTVTIAASDGEPARVARHDWGRCKNGCHEPETYITLDVPCDSRPHCDSCECSGEHHFLLSEQDLAALKAILP
jgi:hypothetical protein